MNYKDYYKDLSVGKTATSAEIKKAYRKLANKYHPDKTKGDKVAEEKFKEINEANEVLSDPVKRKKYDQFGADWKQYEAGGAQAGGFDWSKYSNDRGRQSQRTSTNEYGSMFSDDGTGDLFEMLFGQHSNSQRRGRRTAAAKGEDLETETTLSLEEAYQGSIRILQLNGQTIKVTVKPGVADQQMLRIAGKGRDGSNGGPSGDLYLTIKVASDPEFQRKGNDLYCERPLELYTAVIGGKMKIKTLKDTVNIDISQETQNGKMLRLLGRGMPVYGTKNEFGNLYVTISIQIPSHLTEQEIELFKKLADLKK
jgi:curved DNA-binding protein